MKDKVCEFSFNITQWNISTDRELTSNDWLSEDKLQLKTGNRVLPKLDFLSPLKRRRLSDSARLFVDAVWPLLSDNVNIPVIYASSNSEINRNFALWKSLLSEGDISPTSFSLSVHNALVGQWSELSQVKQETIALTSRVDNLEVALLEAYLLLQEGIEKALVVVVETPLSEDYNPQPIYRQPFAYALAFVVERGNNYRLNLFADNMSLSDKIQDNALSWVRHHYLSATQWRTQSSQGGYWQWCKD